MFERCDAGTTAVIDLAVAESRRLGNDWLGTEHVLVAFGQRSDLLPKAAARLLPEAPAIRAAVARLVSPPPPSTAPELLKTVGVDLDHVRAAVRRTFGDEALDRLSRRRVHQPWQPWRRPSRRCTHLLSGTMSMAPRLKQAFERAGEEADRRQRAIIAPGTLLLGMIDVEDALSNRLLRDLDVDPHQLRQALLRLGAAHSRGFRSASRSGSCPVGQPHRPTGVCDQSVTTALQRRPCDQGFRVVTSTFALQRWWARGDLNFDSSRFATYC